MFIVMLLQREVIFRLAIYNVYDSGKSRVYIELTRLFIIILSMFKCSRASFSVTIWLKMFLLFNIGKFVYLIQIRSTCALVIILILVLNVIEFGYLIMLFGMR